MNGGPNHRDRLDDAVKLREQRREDWRRHGERAAGRNIAMIGALGWAIVGPTLIGVFAGRWLDRHFASGVFWTLGLMVGGLTLGCRIAWNRMHSE